MKHRSQRLWLVFTLVFFSGVSALIYQVVWQKYLAILLGAQARATAIVLAIYLGGISVGYAVFGRWCRWKRWNLLGAYAIVEVGMAIWALLFPTLFKVAMPLAAFLYRMLGVGNLAIDVVLSVALVGVPTFLMGGTLPLLTQGLARDLREASGTHARIYGFNTVGGCLGCLFAGYLLIPATTLPFASYLAGFINALIASVAWFVFANEGQVNEPVVAAADERTDWKGFFQFNGHQGMLLIVGGLSGFYLITLETVLIRLMGLATGSSNYNFTLIVAIFIFALGIGSLLVRDLSVATTRRLFWNQILVAGTLCALYFSTDYWSYWVHVVRVLLRDLPQAFPLYQGLLGLLFLVVLVVPIGLAGFSLPLCFHLIKDRKERLGERVGQLYSVNTIGCVLGAVGGGYMMLNFVDLDTLFKICIGAALVTVVAAARLYFDDGPSRPIELSFASMIASVVVLATVIAPRWSRERFVQPFRNTQPIAESFQGAAAFGNFLGRSTKFLFWKDGPNTSVGIGSTEYQGKELSRTIFVNGKSDGNTRGDFFTTIMLAHIPGLLAKSIENSLVIGFGTGITVGSLTRYPDAKHIDVAEISNFSISEAHYFDPYNGGVSRNPRVHFHEMDAFRFLGGTTRLYDVIVSEPSNPWVAGVENLYSADFYEIAAKKLTPDGMFVQWIHTYSFDDALLKMVLKTMTTQFPIVSVFQLKGGDLALVGTRQPISDEQLARAEQRMRTPMVSLELKDVGIQSLETILALELMPPTAIPRFVENAEIHTLESPRLSNRAARAFFTNSFAQLSSTRRKYKEFFQAIDKSLLARKLGNRLPSQELLGEWRKVFCDESNTRTTFLCEEVLAITSLLDPSFGLKPYEQLAATREIASVATLRAPEPSRFGEKDLAVVYRMFETYKRFASPLARIPTQFLDRHIDRCLATTPVTSTLRGECMLQRILLLEATDGNGAALRQRVAEYLSWFPSADTSAPNYRKLEEAKNILARMTVSP